MLGPVPEAIGTLAWGKFSWLGLPSPIHERGDDTPRGCVSVCSNKEKMAVSLCGVGSCWGPTEFRRGLWGAR